MRTTLLVALCALVAACGAGTEARGPQTPPARAAASRVVLYEQTVTVEMSDRSFCTGPRGRRGRDWNGVLQGCPYLWPYRATLPAGRVARLPLRPGEGGAGRVEITDSLRQVQIWTGPH